MAPGWCFPGGGAGIAPSNDEAEGEEEEEEEEDEEDEEEEDEEDEGTGGKPLMCFFEKSALKMVL